MTPKYLTSQEVRWLFDAIQSPRDKAMFAVLFWRGLRASEVGSLDIGSVDLIRSRISVRRVKGSHAGEYHLSPEEIETLRRWLRVRGARPGPLFPSRRGGPISRFQIHALMKKYATLAGLPAEKAHPHALKHGIAVLLMERGLDISDVQDWLGHVSLRNTAIYARITNRRREDVARRVYEIQVP